MNSLNFGFITRSTAMQLVVFSIIPIIWWGIKGKKNEPFFKYFGFTKPNPQNKYFGLSILIYCLVWTITHLPAFTKYTQTSSNVYTGLGVSALLPILIVSFIQQGLAEELLFRGFINKRLINKFGFQFGNIMQSVIFGAMHIIFASNLNAIGTIVVFATTFIGGYILGYLSEKTFKGSIIPSILLHGLGNFIINIMQAFSK